MQDEKEHVKQKLIDNGYVGNAKTLKKNIHVELQSMWKEIKDKNPDVYKKWFYYHLPKYFRRMYFRFYHQEFHSFLSFLL